MHTLRAMVIAVIALLLPAAGANAGFVATYAFESDAPYNAAITGDPLPEGVEVGPLFAQIGSLNFLANSGVGSSGGVYAYMPGYRLRLQITVPAAYDLVITGIALETKVLVGNKPVDLTFEVDGAPIHSHTIKHTAYAPVAHESPDVWLSTPGVDRVHTIDLVGETAGGVQYLDDVTIGFDLVPAPEPSSLLAAAVGGPLLLTRRVRGCRGRSTGPRAG